MAVSLYIATAVPYIIYFNGHCNQKVLASRADAVTNSELATVGVALDAAQGIGMLACVQVDYPSGVMRSC
jgi:hypothetical protein